MTEKILNSGLYYKNITIVNDASRVLSECFQNLDQNLQSPITRLEWSITLLENIYGTGIICL
jgi:hypothetical protein